MHLQGAIFRALALEPLTARELADRLGVSRRTVTSSLLALRRKGKTRPEGPAHIGVKHYAVVGATPPVYMKGKAPGSLRVLMAPKPRRKRKPPTPKPVIALEACWGWLPSTSPQLHAED